MKIWAFGRKRRASIFRACQNKYLREFTADIAKDRVLNMGAKPKDNDKEGSAYEHYFKGSEFRTIDLGADADPRHIHGDMMNPPPEMGQFDLVLAMSLIEHIDRPWTAAPHIENAVKPGGHLYIAMPWFYPVHEGPYYGDHWRATPTAMPFLFENLEVIKTEYYPSSIFAIRDRNRYWNDKNSAYAGFSMLMRKPA